VGDAINESAIRSLLEDCNAVVSTIGQRLGEPMVASQASKNVLKIMNDFDIQRYVLLAGINIDTPFDKKSKKTTAATDWMKTNHPEIQKDRQLTYDLLIESNADWTLVRVSFIEFTDATLKVIANLEDCSGDKISSFDIADFIIQEMIEEKFVRESPFIANI
jgi:putative NADH-flavin reductase